MFVLLKDKTKLIWSINRWLSLLKATCDSFAKVTKVPEIKISAEIIFSYRS